MTNRRNVGRETADEILLLLVKNPILGKAKTRIAQEVGDRKALAIYKELLAKTEQISSNWSGHRHLYYSHFIDEMDIWSSDLYQKFLQPSGDLGTRMSEAFRAAFQQGAQRVCVIGSDCYALTTDIITEAFHVLEKESVVIGPATDGGYYLIGSSEYLPFLFEDIDWSTDQVLSQTRDKIKQHALSYHLLPPLTDIDHYGDWVRATENE